MSVLDTVTDGCKEVQKLTSIASGEWRLSNSFASCPINFSRDPRLLSSLVACCAAESTKTEVQMFAANVRTSLVR